MNLNKLLSDLIYFLWFLKTTGFFDESFTWEKFKNMSKKMSILLTSFLCVYLIFGLNFSKKKFFETTCILNICVWEILRTLDFFDFKILFLCLPRANFNGDIWPEWTSLKVWIRQNLHNWFVENHWRRRNFS